MRSSTFLRATALTTGTIGLTLLLFPSFTANFFLPATDHMADIFIRFLGSSLIGYTYLNWHTAQAVKPTQLQATLAGNFSTLSIALIISIIGVLDGSLKASGWIIVAVHAIFCSGFGYYLYKSWRN